MDKEVKEGGGVKEKEGKWEGHKVGGRKGRFRSERRWQSGKGKGKGRGREKEERRREVEGRE